MPLTDQEKSELRSSIAATIDLDEPEALLGTLRRAAQRRAEYWGGEPNFVGRRWLNLANALAQAELTIDHMNAPKAKQDAALGYSQSGARQTTNPEMILQAQANDDAAGLQAAIYKAV